MIDKAVKRIGKLIKICAQKGCISDKDESIIILQLSFQFSI